MMLNAITHSFKHVLMCCLCTATPALCIADDDTNETDTGAFDSSAWHGTWQAENTTFTLRVVPDGNRFAVEAVQPLGLGWTSSDGIINGNSGTINVEYQGVTALVMVQLISDSSAIVRSMSCQPDYHVVCTLVRNQQALFLKH